jgi:hypothetical protein
MEKHNPNELPIRSKLRMLDDIIQIICYLHAGKRMDTDALIKDLKTRAVFFDEVVQRDVLIFCEQILFQYDYDPWHKVTPDVQRAADQLIEDLGFSSIRNLSLNY